MKASNTKIQIPKKLQIPNSKFRFSIRRLVFATVVEAETEADMP
jgi:hypothetical protein